MNRREQILLKLISIFESDTSYKKTQRQRPDVDSFKSLPDTLFPLVSIEAAAPRLESVVNQGRHGFATKVSFKFNLVVDITIYDKAVGEVDTAFGSLYNKVFKSLFADPLFGGLVDDMTINPKADARLEIKPYFAFRLQLHIKYKTHLGI